MARRNVEFSIEITGLKVSFKGSQDSGQEIAARVAQGISVLTSAPEMLMHDPGQAPKSINAGTADVPTPTPATPAPQAKRKARTGKSPQGLIETLIQNGYFDNPRSTEEISSELAKKGHTYLSATLGTPLARLAQKGLITREKADEKSNYMYKKVATAPAEKPANP